MNAQLNYNKRFIAGKKNNIIIEEFDKNEKYSGIKNSLVSGRSGKQSFLDSEIERVTSGSDVSKIDRLDDYTGVNTYFRDGIEGKYATTGFDLVDLTPNMPLSKFWYQTIMPIKYGGGFIEQAIAFRIGLAPAKMRLVGGETNEVPLVGVDDSRIYIPAYTTTIGLILGQVNLLKSRQINYDILGVHLEAIRLSYQNALEWFAFMGNVGLENAVGQNEYHGLINFTADEILAIDTTAVNWNTLDVNGFIELMVEKYNKLLIANQYDRDKVPNHILIPPQLWSVLLKSAVVGNVGTSNGTGIAVSVYDYLVTQLETRIGQRILISELPYLDANATVDTTTSGIISNGTNNNGRIVMYRYDESVIRMYVAVALTGGILAWSPTENAWRQNYLAVTTPPMVIYPSTILYIDNIA